MVLTQDSSFRFQDSGVGAGLLSLANRIRPVFIFAIIILDGADAGFKFQVSGFRGWCRFVSVGANRIRPIFVFAIFILDSAEAHFRFHVSGCWCRFVVGANRIRPIFVFAIFIHDSADARFRFHVSRVNAGLLLLGRIAFALFLYLRYLSSIVLAHISGFRIQVSGVGAGLLSLANRIRPIFVFAIFILDSAGAHFRFQDSSFRGWCRFVVGANRIRPIFVFAIFILDSADAYFRFQDSGVGVGLLLGRIAFALFLYLRYISSIVLTHISGFKIQCVGAGLLSLANRIRPVFIFAIMLN